MSNEAEMEGRVSRLEVRVEAIAEIDKKIDILVSGFNTLNLGLVNMKNDYVAKPECKGTCDGLRKDIDAEVCGIKGEVTAIKAVQKRVYLLLGTSTVGLIFWLIEQLITKVKGP